MATEDCEIGQCGSAPPSAPGSPKEKIKFLCSHGGKILPRPSDGQLKYVGGETRVISVHRDITFHELMKKLKYQLDCDIVLKYQLIPDDLEVLVTVKSDQDLRFMIDECNRCKSLGSPRLRAFLFPAKPVTLDPLSVTGEAIEQRYIDAINGIVRANKDTATKPPLRSSLSQNQNRPMFSISSGCSSPNSPDEEAINSHDHAAMGFNTGLLNGRSRMHKVQSMPSFGSSIAAQQNSGNYTPTTNEFSQSYHQNYRHRKQNQYQNQRYGHQSSRPTVDPFKGFNRDRCFSVRSMVGPQHASYYPKPGRGANGCYTQCLMNQFDDFGYSYDRRSEYAARSASPSPIIPSSPQYGHSIIRPLDTQIVGAEMGYNFELTPQL